LNLIAVVNRFKASFPGIDVSYSVDLSKVDQIVSFSRCAQLTLFFKQFHDVQIDTNLNTTGKAGCDIAILQTLQDFDRWGANGRSLLVSLQ